MEFYSVGNFNNNVFNEEQFRFVESCYYGDIDYINNHINNIDGYYINLGFINACGGGHMNIVKLLSDKVVNVNFVYEKAFDAACFNKHFDIIHYIRSIYSGRYLNIVRNAYIMNHTEYINEIINMGIYNDYNEGLCGACEGGHINLINMMIEKGADNYDDGFYFACNGFHIDIVRYMLNKDVSNLARRVNGIICIIMNLERKFVIAQLNSKTYNNSILIEHFNNLDIILSNRTKDYNISMYKDDIEKSLEIVKLLISEGSVYEPIKNSFCYELNILYYKNKKIIDDHIIYQTKYNNLLYNLLYFYHIKIQDIDRLINKYLY